jgi:hypothetical protein
MRYRSILSNAAPHAELDIVLVLLGFSRLIVFLYRALGSYS